MATEYFRAQIRNDMGKNASFRWLRSPCGERTEDESYEALTAIQEEGPGRKSWGAGTGGTATGMETGRH